METFYIIYFFLIGTIFGSFYNVVGYRLPNNMSLIKPGSHCPNCNHKLSPLELVPIFSYIIQGGKCKHCKKKIPIFYPCFEALTGLLFVVAYLIFGFTWNLLIALTFVSVLVIVILSDYKYMVIPDELLIVGGLLIVIEQYFISGIDTVMIGLTSGVVAFLVMFCIKLFGDSLFKKDSLGGGDIKLMAFIGLCLPLPISILPIFLGTFIALPISLLILAIKKDNVLPFGPYLSIAALLLYFYQITPSEFYQFILNLS